MENLQENQHGEHHHEKPFTIIVNGQQTIVTAREMSYEEIVNLAFDNNPPTGPYIVITVTYRRGHGNKPEGNLGPDETVKIKDGMIFNVTATDKS